MTAMIQIDRDVGRRDALPPAAARAPLLGRSREELEALGGALGLPAFRGRQLAAWIYCKRARDFSAMTDLPQALRERLSQDYCVGRAEVAAAQAASDGTTKLLLELADGKQIETVLLPYQDRTSVCISSQVGCPV